MLLSFLYNAYEHYKRVSNRNVHAFRGEELARGYIIYSYIRYNVPNVNGLWCGIDK